MWGGCGEDKLSTSLPELTVELLRSGRAAPCPGRALTQPPCSLQGQPWCSRHCSPCPCAAMQVSHLLGHCCGLGSSCWGGQARNAGWSGDGGLAGGATPWLGQGCMSWGAGKGPRARWLWQSRLQACWCWVITGSILLPREGRSWGSSWQHLQSLGDVPCISLVMEEGLKDCFPKPVFTVSLCFLQPLPHQVSAAMITEIPVSRWLN